MKKIMLSLGLALGVLSAQAQDLPAPSPKSTIEQRVGLTNFTVEYSRPSARDREIFGDLVPYDKLWRTGANQVTTIEFSTAINLQGEEVPAGKYSLLTIPGEDMWVIVLNKNTELWGVGNYSPDEDVLRVEVPVENSEFMETFTINFHDLRSESANLVLQWAEAKVAIPLEMEVKKQALANIDKALEDATDENRWQVYRNAANYYHNNNLETAQALEYVNQSLKANDKGWYGHWLKAEILAEAGKYSEAVKSAQTAIERGSAEASEGGTEFSYEEMISKSMDQWKRKTSN